MIDNYKKVKKQLLPFIAKKQSKEIRKEEFKTLQKIAQPNENQ